MEFSDVLKARYSVRAYTDRQVEPDVLAAVLEDARHCASWSNTRGYLLAIAQGERLERIKRAYLKAWDDSAGMRQGKASAFLKAALGRRLPTGDFKTWAKYPPELRERQVANGKRFYTHLGIKRGDQQARDDWQRKNYEFFGAPVGGFLFVHGSLLPFSAQDAGLMFQTLMLSAADHGLGTVPLGNVATWRHPVDAEFEIPSEYKLITGFALGYPDDTAHANAYRAEHLAVPLAVPKH